MSQIINPGSFDLCYACETNTFTYKLYLIIYPSLDCQFCLEICNEKDNLEEICIPQNRVTHFLETADAQFNLDACLRT